MTDDNAITRLARPDIQRLTPYVPATYRDGLTRLNANEAPWTSQADETERGLNHYPPARPEELTRLLAKHYTVDETQLLVTRGSSEAIDLLIRCFCRPGLDAIVVNPPTFGMYQVYADIQGARVDAIPLNLATPGRLPVDAIAAGWSGTHRLLFVTTPNNPTGSAVAPADIRDIAGRLDGRGIVVIDAAYIEFGDANAVMALAALPNVIIMRTLSKAYGLAGARCGALISDADTIAMVARVMPPYAVPTPSAETALAALASESLQVMPERIAALLRERQRVAEALAQLNRVKRVWPSDANFLLVEFDDAARAFDDAERAGFLLRDFSNQPATRHCLRITIGARADNDSLLQALSETDTGATT